MLFTIKFIVLMLWSGYAMSQGIGSLVAVSLINDEAKIDGYGITWTYQGKEFVIAYEPFESLIQKYPNLEVGISSTSNEKYLINRGHHFVRNMYIYGKQENGSWRRESTELYQGIYATMHQIEPRDFLIKEGGTALIKALDNGYVIITQNYRDSFKGDDKYNFVLTILNPNNKEGWIYWSTSVKRVHLNSRLSWAKEIVKISENEYELVMTRGEPNPKLYFNYSKNGSEFEYYFNGTNNWFGRNK